MSDITLSQAVRSNLLSLQNTASLLDTTQTRLATGNKVNSALDNPTSYFTASSLNARSNDLGNLLDSVSNAIQTIQAANDGITSITKLVESAQATANQAQQLSETVPSTSGAVTESDAIVHSADTSSLTIANAITEVDGTEATSDLTAVTIHAASAGSPAGPATVTGGAIADGTQDAITNGFADGDTLTFTDGTTTQTVDFYDSSVASYSGSNIGVDVAAGTSINSVLAAIQTGLQTAGGSFASATVGITGGNFVATLGTDTTHTLAIGGTAATGLGIPGTTANPTALVPSTSDTTGTITVNGQNVALADGDTLSNILSKLNTASGAATGTNAFSVSNASGVLTITGTGGNSVTVGGNAATLTALGLSAATSTGTQPAAATAGTITINGQNVALAAGDTSANILTKLQTAATASTGTNAFTVTNASGVLTITGTGGNNLVVGGNAATLTALGLSAATTTGTPASTGTVVQIANPARSALISQYNGLLDQIDQLTSDASYNGNNLLSGTSSQLKVVFNETGTSSLTVNGKDTSSTGLGLAKLTVGTEFDTNASITTIQGKLKTATDTLRADASSFGSSLSVVQTRQDFTKTLINTLQTGASNLTLADSNEEAANLLALQTRQSLSTKALSLASQSDQNVLRLLQ